VADGLSRAEWPTGARLLEQCNRPADDDYPRA